MRRVMLRPPYVNSAWRTKRGRSSGRAAEGLTGAQTARAERGDLLGGGVALLRDAGQVLAVVFIESEPAQEVASSM